MEYPLYQVIRNDESSARYSEKESTVRIGFTFTHSPVSHVISLAE